MTYEKLKGGKIRLVGKCMDMVCDFCCHHKKKISECYKGRNTIVKSRPISERKVRK